MNQNKSTQRNEDQILKFLEEYKSFSQEKFGKKPNIVILQPGTLLTFDLVDTLETGVYVKHIFDLNEFTVFHIENKKLHRLDGPAYQRFFINGNQVRYKWEDDVRWYYQNKLVSGNTFTRRIQLIAKDSIHIEDLLLKDNYIVERKFLIEDGILSMHVFNDRRIGYNRSFNGTRLKYPFDSNGEYDI